MSLKDETRLELCDELADARDMLKYLQGQIEPAAQVLRDLHGKIDNWQIRVEALEILLEQDAPPVMKDKWATFGDDDSAPYTDPMPDFIEDIEIAHQVRERAAAGESAPLADFIEDIDEEDRP